MCIHVQLQQFNACCGTHVKSTSQLQFVKLFSCQHSKGIAKIGFAAGNRAIGIMQELYTVSRELTTVLKTGRSDHVAAATKISNDVVSICKE
jgi:alanyl-tRNA synthetase